MKRSLSPAGRDGARPLQEDRSRTGSAGRGHPALRVQHRWCLAAGRCGHRPLRKEEKVASTTRASGAQRSVCGAGAKKWARIAAEIIPKVSSNAGQSLSRPAGDSSLYTREPLGTGGYGLPRRFAPRNDSPDPLSFRGGPTGRRGNPFPFTMDGGSGRRGRRPLRKVYRSPGNGPMWASAPTESPINHPN